MTGNRLTAPVLALTVGLLTLPVAALAMDKELLTAEDAIAIALEAEPGTIAEAELDQYEGRQVFDIEVLNAAGEEIEFQIDAKTGEILNEWIDDDPTDDPVAGTAEETDG
ncbi:MAG: PepSY domain-containing protein [Dinoroseobacter sp.]|nr:PepSY domain-containing protein [Dinoroseobacter sp.]